MESMVVGTLRIEQGVVGSSFVVRIFDNESGEALGEHVVSDMAMLDAVMAVIDEFVASENPAEAASVASGPRALLDALMPGLGSESPSPDDVKRLRYLAAVADGVPAPDASLYADIIRSAAAGVQLGRERSEEEAKRVASADGAPYLSPAVVDEIFVAFATKPHAFDTKWIADASGVTAVAAAKILRRLETNGHVVGEKVPGFGAAYFWRLPDEVVSWASDRSSPLVKGRTVNAWLKVSAVCRAFGGRDPLPALVTEEPMLRPDVMQLAAAARDVLAEADTKSPHVCAMLFPREEEAQRVAIPGGETPDRIHVTALYFGRAASVFGAGGSPEALAAIVGKVVEARGSFIGAVLNDDRFGPESAPVLVAHVSDTDNQLLKLNFALREAATAAGYHVSTQYDYQPHVSLAHGEEGKPLPKYIRDGATFTFDGLTFSVGDQKWQFSFLGMPDTKTPDTGRNIPSAPQFVVGDRVMVDEFGGIFARRHGRVVAVNSLAALQRAHERTYEVLSDAGASWPVRAENLKRESGEKPSVVLDPVLFTEPVPPSWAMSTIGRAFAEYEGAKGAAVTEKERHLATLFDAWEKWRRDVPGAAAVADAMEAGASRMFAKWFRARRGVAEAVAPVAAPVAAPVVIDAAPTPVAAPEAVVIDDAMRLENAVVVRHSVSHGTTIEPSDFARAAVDAAVSMWGAPWVRYGASWQRYGTQSQRVPDVSLDAWAARLRGDGVKNVVVEEAASEGEVESPFQASSEADIILRPAGNDGTHYLRVRTFALAEWLTRWFLGNLEFSKGLDHYLTTPYADRDGADDWHPPRFPQVRSDSLLLKMIRDGEVSRQSVMFGVGNAEAASVAEKAIADIELYAHGNDVLVKVLEKTQKTTGVRVTPHTLEVNGQGSFRFAVATVNARTVYMVCTAKDHAKQKDDGKVIRRWFDASGESDAMGPWTFVDSLLYVRTPPPAPASNHVYAWMISRTEALEQSGYKQKSALYGVEHGHRLFVLNALRCRWKVPYAAAAEYPELVALYDLKPEAASDESVNDPTDPDLTVAHTAETGTVVRIMVEGERKWNEAIKGLRMGFKWYVDHYYRNQSRGVRKPTIPLDVIANRLRSAGAKVKVVLDVVEQAAADAIRREHKEQNARRSVERAQLLAEKAQRLFGEAGSAAGRALTANTARRSRIAKGMSVRLLNEAKQAAWRAEALARRGVNVGREAMVDHVTIGEFRAVREALKSELADIIDTRTDDLTGKVDAHRAAMSAAPGLAFFATPAWLAERMVDEADIGDGDVVLEPSAGMGAIVDAVTAKRAKVLAIELAAERYAFLADRYAGNEAVQLVHDDFVELSSAIPPSFDAVLMNPPFSGAGSRSLYADHVLQAIGYLRPLGSLAAVVPASFAFSQEAKVVELRELLESWGATVNELPEGAFKDAGTGVRTLLIVATKPGEGPNGGGELPAPPTDDAAPVAPVAAPESASEVVAPSVPEMRRDLNEVQRASVDGLAERVAARNGRVEAVYVDDMGRGFVQYAIDGKGGKLGMVFETGQFSPSPNVDELVKKGKAWQVLYVEPRASQEKSKALTDTDVETLRMIRADTLHTWGFGGSFNGAQLDSVRKLSRLGLADWKPGKGYSASDKGREELLRIDAKQKSIPTVREMLSSDPDGVASEKEEVHLEASLSSLDDGVGEGIIRDPDKHAIEYARRVRRAVGDAADPHNRIDGYADMPEAKRPVGVRREFVVKAIEMLQPDLARISAAESAAMVPFDGVPDYKKQPVEVRNGFGAYTHGFMVGFPLGTVLRREDGVVFVKVDKPNFYDGGLPSAKDPPTNHRDPHGYFKVDAYTPRSLALGAASIADVQPVTTGGGFGANAESKVVAWKLYVKMPRDPKIVDEVVKEASGEFGAQFVDALKTRAAVFTDAPLYFRGDTDTFLSDRTLVVILRVPEPEKAPKAEAASVAAPDVKVHPWSAFGLDAASKALGVTAGPALGAGLSGNVFAVVGDTKRVLKITSRSAEAYAVERVSLARAEGHALDGIVGGFIGPVYVGRYPGEQLDVFAYTRDAVTPFGDAEANALPKLPSPHGPASALVQASRAAVAYNGAMRSHDDDKAATAMFDYLAALHRAAEVPGYEAPVATMVELATAQWTRELEGPFAVTDARAPNMGKSLTGATVLYDFDINGRPSYESQLPQPEPEVTGEVKVTMHETTGGKPGSDADVHFTATDSAGRTVGELYFVEPFNRIHDTASCGDSLEKLRARIGRPDLSVRVIRRSQIVNMEKNANTGVGTALYLAAAEEAAKRGAAIIADECHERSTSPEAKRVWEGRRFNAKVVREGLVAVDVEHLPPLAAERVTGDEVRKEVEAASDAGATAGPDGDDDIVPTVENLTEALKTIAAWRRSFFTHTLRAANVESSLNYAVPGCGACENRGRFDCPKHGRSTLPRFGILSEDLVDRTRRRVETYAKKAERCSVPSKPGIVVSEAVIYPYVYLTPTKVRTTEYREMYAVALTGQLPTMGDGWTLLARIDFEEAGNVVVSAKGKVAPPDARTRDTMCDHCHTRRARISTYALRHDDGTVKYVGRNCLADFIRDTGVDVLMAVEWATESVKDEEEENWPRGGSSRYVSTKYLLVCAARAIRERGFFVPSRSEEHTPTAVDALNSYPGGGVPYTPPGIFVTPHLHTDADYDQATAALDFAANIAGTTDYEHNLKVILAGDVVNIRKHASFAVSVFAAMHRHIHGEREKAKKAQGKVSAHVGEKGVRSVFTLRLKATPSWETDYGTQYANIMEDADGNVFVWKSGTKAGEPGDLLRGKCTIKDHGEKNGTKQTLLSRCSLEKIEG